MIRLSYRLEWARNVWSDFQSGNVRWSIGAEYPVCPLCFYRKRLDDSEELYPDTARQIYALVMTTPPLDGPFHPDGPDLAEGCRCWRGYTSLRSA